MPISSVFSVAQRALLAEDVALGVIGGNIANVNTPGYTRQTANLEADPPVASGLGVVAGNGVHVASVTQILDPLLERRILSVATDRGADAERRHQLSALSDTLSDLDGSSLGAALSGFFDAADALARNPEGLAERQTLLGRATSLVTELARRHDAVATLQRNTDGRFVDVATHANDLLQRVADLNRAITVAETGGDPANGLRDQRRSVLSELAGTMAISTVDDGHGGVTVSASNGLVLVQGGDVAHQIVTRTAGVGIDGLALHEAGTLDATGAFVAVPGAFASGALGGLASVRDGELVRAAGALDDLAVAVRDQVNAVQTDPGALDLDGNSTAGVPLFTGTGAADLAVAITDARQIGAALSTQPGDNQNALRLADLRRAAVGALGGASFATYVAGQQTAVGADASAAADRATATDSLAAQLENQRASVSGVNLNEELTNLLKAQRAFQAASQVISVANGMLDDLFRILP
jgi:flagellar hook-associated protein 1 FlgK